MPWTNWGGAALALLLGGGLALALLSVPADVWGAPFDPPASDAAGAESADLFYRRIQTVTLVAPPSAAVYTTSQLTNFKIQMMDYWLGSWIYLPADARVIHAFCSGSGCQEPVLEDNVITFPGEGAATVYLEYETSSRASRAPGSRTISLQYPVGPEDPEQRIALTNTVLFTRTLHPPPDLDLGSPIMPPTYTCDDDARAIHWVFTETGRQVFEAAFVEPLLGSDLVIDRFLISKSNPRPGETVYYTVTVRNAGNYRTGRGVLAELFVRPSSVGPPTNLHDHDGAWFTYEMGALFKWHGTTPPSPWFAGLEPGQTLTGSTSLLWPSDCSVTPCWAWAKVDPTYLSWGGGIYEWYGYNPEGFDCAWDGVGLPTCIEENNNVATAVAPDDGSRQVYLPLVLRRSSSSGP